MVLGWCLECSSRDSSACLEDAKDRVLQLSRHPRHQDFANELQSELLAGDYIGDYMGEYTKSLDLSSNLSPKPLTLNRKLDCEDVDFGALSADRTNLRFASFRSL